MKSGKKLMNDELNRLLGLDADWTRLSEKDLKEIHNRLVNDMTLPRALALNRETLRRKIETMPILTALRKRYEIVRRDYQRNMESQNAETPANQNTSAPTTPTREEPKRKPNYIS